MHPSVTHRRAPERGASLVELLVALIIISIGILAVARLFPAGTHSQLQDRMVTSGSYFAQEKVEQLSAKGWNDADLSLGRHPPGIAVETLGDTGRWERFYQVDLMPAPLDNLKRITVTVSWTFQGTRSVSAVTYLRR